MLFRSALFTIVGDFIEPIPCIVIFMPIVAALNEIGGINPVHMGVVLIVTLAFGLITPPYGLALLMASKFVGVRFSQALRASLSIYVCSSRRSRRLSSSPMSCCGCRSTSSRSRSAASRTRAAPAISAHNKPYRGFSRHDTDPPNLRPTLT